MAQPDVIGQRAGTVALTSAVTSEAASPLRGAFRVPDVAEIS